MKKILYVAIVVLIAACGKKNDTVAPDAAAKIAGTYTVSRFALSGSGANDFDATLPRSGTINGVNVTQSGQLVITRQNESSVSLSLTVKTTGQADDTTDLGTAEVKGSDLYDGATKIGTADGTNLSIDATDNGVRVIITAKK
ncbi:hypothetical protein [Fibrella aestuarina]|uniref:hypothetical protein n=1 Tax=Fibrella aestuarina TaxID=651143 RepID=UPI00059D1158|nr:hypothetical protein [Fibrella aestuarina]